MNKLALKLPIDVFLFHFSLILITKKKKKNLKLLQIQQQTQLLKTLQPSIAKNHSNNIPGDFKTDSKATKRKKRQTGQQTHLYRLLWSFTPR